MVATRLEAKFNPVIGFLPQLGLAAVLLIGGNRVIHAHLTIGQFTAVLPLPEHADRPDALARRDARPGPARDRLRRAHLPGARPRAADRRRRPARRRCRPATATSQLRDVTLRYDEGDDFGAVHAGPRELSLDNDSDGNAARRAYRAARAVRRHLDVAGRHAPSRSSARPARARRASSALISRLYDASAGAVLLDGADVRDVDLSSLRQAVAVVSDDPFLFSASVAENIAYGRPDAEPRGGRSGRAPRPGLRLRRAPAAGLRHARRRARAVAVRRPAPAPGDRSRAARRPARADPRRRDLGRRRLDRAEHQARARRGDGRAHDVRHRASPLDDLAGR